MKSSGHRFSMIVACMPMHTFTLPCIPLRTEVSLPGGRRPGSEAQFVLEIGAMRNIGLCYFVVVLPAYPSAHFGRMFLHGIYMFPRPFPALGGVVTCYPWSAHPKIVLQRAPGVPALKEFHGESRDRSLRETAGWIRQLCRAGMIENAWGICCCF